MWNNGLCQRLERLRSQVLLEVAGTENVLILAFNLLAVKFWLLFDFLDVSLTGFITLLCSLQCYGH